MLLCSPAWCRKIPDPMASRAVFEKKNQPRGVIGIRGLLITCGGGVVVVKWKASRDRFSSNSTISFKGHIENFIILQNEPWICWGKVSIVNLTEKNMFLMIKWSSETYFFELDLLSIIDTYLFTAYSRLILQYYGSC